MARTPFPTLWASGCAHTVIRRVRVFLPLLAVSRTVSATPSPLLSNTVTAMARKAGLSAKEIFNTCSLEEVEEYLGERRKRADRSG